MSKNRILSQMFDVRPVDSSGDLDWERIKSAEKIIYLKRKNYIPSSFLSSEKNEEKKEISDEIHVTPETEIKKSWTAVPKKPPEKISENRIFERRRAEGAANISPGRSLAADNFGGIKFIKEERKISHFPEKQKSKEKISFAEQYAEIEKPEIPVKPEENAENIKSIEKRRENPSFYYPKKSNYQEEEYIKETESPRKKFHFSDFFLPAEFALSFGLSKLKKAAFSFAAASIILFLIIGSSAFFAKSMKLEKEVLGVSTEGCKNLESAVDNIKKVNPEASILDFQKARENFSEASKNINAAGGKIAEIARFIPFASKISSAKFAVEAGKHISSAGESLSSVVKVLASAGNPLENHSESVSLLDIFLSMEENLKSAKSELAAARENIDKINIDDLPEDRRAQFLEVKEKLPSIVSLIGNFSGNSDIFIDVLGGNGPRKYLFLFQNNQEMRATGGFIGSYGLLDINSGHVRGFFIDGIFNPGGQLTDKIVPPKPIQKISAAWSLHDSNWWPDFPASSKKAIDFYERTGGPTADGIIAITPTVMEKLLEITGPVKMDEYGVTLDSDNFIAQTQQEVEVNYDKEENQPKKILADLAPIVLDKIFNAKDPGNISKAIDVLSQGLNQKHILLYSENKDLQKIISDQGWSGEILDASRDYLAVINTNINGYKTDGVIDEKIEHQAEIQEDGSVIDTLTITRKHNGGESIYPWWNKVNTNYLRVYVPRGSELLEVEGQTREFNDPPLDYNNLGFKRDPDVQKEEENMKIDEQTGTRTYEEAGKTVFANWTYVSPKETLVVKYEYLLPFRVLPGKGKGFNGSYSLLAQKQSGSIGSKFSSVLKYPDGYKAAWKIPEEASGEQNSLKLETDLKTDKFIGAAFEKQ